MLVHNDEGREVRLQIGKRVHFPVQGHLTREVCGTILEIQVGEPTNGNAPHVVLQRHDGWGVDTISRRVLIPCTCQQPVRQYDILDDYWQRVRKAFSLAGPLPEQPDVDAIESLIPEAERAGWQHALPEPDVYAYLAQYAAEMLGVPHPQSEMLSRRILQMVLTGVREEPSLLARLQENVQHQVWEQQPGRYKK